MDGNTGENEWDLTHGRLMAWLREDDPAALARLYGRADRARRENVGDEVHLRGLIEISNHCRRDCAYCGLRAGNAGLARYRMEADEIAACAEQAASFGYGTVVLQAGEDPQFTRDWVSKLVGRIRTGAGVAAALSLGERSRGDLAAWRAAGAERYLLRFETSNARLYARMHPPAPGGGGRDRLEMLRDLRELDYEVGSGVLVGLPGQTYADLVRDLQLFAALELDMIGCGPWIAHPDTPLGKREADGGGDPNPDQVPATAEMACKVIALSRLLCPAANIPATTALATLNRASGREDGLRRGANILMPNCTPVAYRRLYEIYPGKACLDETADECRSGMRRRIEGIGRRVGSGPGGAARTRGRPER